MSRSIRQAAFARQFECLAADCPDTCCQGWSMQLNDATRRRYETSAPELLQSVVEDGAGGFVMRRDEKTDFCVRFENGLCGIHRAHGAEFLGDACYFYPRASRALGNEVLMTAVPSCPETMRLALFGEQPFRFEQVTVERLPESLRDYLPEGMESAQALAIHEAFLSAAGDEAAVPELIFSRIAGVARSLECLPVTQWPEAVPFLFSTADARLPVPQPRLEDAFNLLHALCGLCVATHKKPSPRLTQTIAAMEQALHAGIDWQNISIQTHDDSAACLQALQQQWLGRHAARYAGVLRRWLQLQLSVALFPFGGLGGALSERVTIIGVRFATFRLALMCECGIRDTALPQDVVVRVAQSLARLLDHLADPAFSVQVYQSVGWNSEARLRGLAAI